MLKVYLRKFYQEALAYSRLKDGNVVPFIGVYSTPKHPLALVFEFMDHLNLGEYLRNNEDIGRHELVHFHSHFYCLSHQRFETSCWK